MPPGKEVRRAAILLACVPILFWILPIRSSGCLEDMLSFQTRGQGDGAVIAVSIADDPEEQAEGLMFVKDMPQTHGMLFVFPRSMEVSLWMENTFIPLDMIFIDETGRIARIHEDAVPHDITSIPSGSAVRYVLELNAGIAEEIGLAPEDIVISPVMGTGCAVDIQAANLVSS